MFSSWRSEKEEDWLRNQELLSGYEDVEPFIAGQFPAAENIKACTSELGEIRQETHSECSNQIPQAVRRVGAEIIECLWDEELHHFVECSREDTTGSIDGHLFVMLCELRTHIEGRKHDRRFYLARAADPDPIASDCRFVIDRIRNVVFDARSQEYLGEILQTSVGRLRDESGKVIGLEVFHSCKGKDGKEFGIDASVMD